MIFEKSVNIRLVSCDNDIAVIGMGCLLPGARNLNQFWQNLLNGTDPIIEIPADRWIWQDYYNAREAVKNRTVSKWGGFVTPSVNLDDLFFQNSTSYYSNLSRAKRLLLEVIWQTLENAGYTSKKLGEFHPVVLIGADPTDKITEGSEKSSTLTLEHLLDSSIYMLSGFISQFFNWNGISFVIDSGQSSSLTSVHVACKYLLAGAAEVALVGGVNVVESPHASISFSHAGLQAKDGRCKSFSNQADGFVRSEGATAIILKPLEAALRDQDNIWAIIKSSVANQGVQLERSRIMPSYEIQKDLLKQAYEQANISLDTLDLLETHGSGTFWGDSVEFKALQSIFQQHTKRKSFCAIGAVKTNLGHLEASGGLIGLIKAILCLKKGCINPNLHFKEPNRNIAFEESPFYWPDKPRFLGNKRRRRAGISSFGLGGANVHVVIENFYRDLPSEEVSKSFLFCISAVNTEDLRNLIAAYINYIKILQEEGNSVTLADMCYTALLGREHFPFRLAITITSFGELRAKLTHIYDTFSMEKSREIFLSQASNIFLSSVPKQNILAVQAQDYMKGFDVNWKKILEKVDYTKVNLPTYPFRDDVFSSQEKIKPNYALLQQKSDDLKNYLTSLLARQLNCSSTDIKLDVPFTSLGIESIVTIKLVRELEEHLEKELPRTIFLDHPTLNALLQSPVLKDVPASISKKQPALLSVLNNTATQNRKDIAIIGMAFRVPTINSFTEFWNLLEKGISTISEIPKLRWDIEQYFDQEYSKLSTIYCRWGSFLSGIEYFDPLFFNISPREAECLDPQQKVLLELAWEALERSGYGANPLTAKKFGVFIGASYTHYLDFLQEIPENNHLGLGNSNAIIANRKCRGSASSKERRIRFKEGRRKKYLHALRKVNG